MDKPGRRFQDRYWARQAHRQEWSAWKKIIRAVISILIIFIGIILLFLPGPGWLVIILGSAILAAENLTLAKIMDSAEFRLRRAWKNFKERRRG